MPEQNENHNDIKELLYALPGADDIDLVILKGQLIAEQLLYEFLKVTAPYPKPLLDDRIPFSMLLKASMSHMEESDITNDHLWEPLKQLNKIRNIIAHKLTSTKLDNEVSKLIEMYESNRGWRPKEYRTGSSVTKLRFAIIGPLHFLSGSIVALREKK